MPEATPLAGVATFPRPAHSVVAMGRSASCSAPAQRASAAGRLSGCRVSAWNMAARECWSVDCLNPVRRLAATILPAASRRNAVLFRTARAAASRRGGPQSVPPQSAPSHIANPKHYIYTTDMNRRIGSLHSAPIGISVGNGGLFVFLHPASVSFFEQHDDAAARKAAAGTHHHITHKQGRKGSARKLPSRFPSETEPEFGFFSPAAVSFSSGTDT